MNDSQSDQSAKMTPEAAVVINRARRSFGVSIMIMLLGFMAVGGALVYRSGKADPVLSAQPPLNLFLPEQANVKSFQLVDGHGFVTFETAGVTELWIFDMVTGELIRKVGFKAE